MFVKYFRQVCPWALNISKATFRGPIWFLNFHLTRFSRHLLNLDFRHCTLYLTSINAITPFIFNIHQPFHVLLPNFLSIIYLYFHCPTFILKATNANISFLPSALFSNSKQLRTITTWINLLYCLPTFLIRSQIYYSISMFFCFTTLLPIFLFFFKS